MYKHWNFLLQNAANAKIQNNSKRNHKDLHRKKKKKKSKATKYKDITFIIGPDLRVAGT